MGHPLGVMRLWAREGAGRPPRVRWALEEAGAEYELVTMTGEESGSPEHRARHPLGRVPVLETGDGALWESAALCLQVADTYSEAGLIPPPGSYERGLVYQWVLFAMAELEPALVALYRVRAGGDDETDAAQQVGARLDVLAAQLHDSDYLVGGRFTIADVVVGGVLSIAKLVEAVPDGAVRAYVERLDARPAKQRAYAA